MTTDFNASGIQVLEGLECVRIRPSMYIGNTSKGGLHHLVWEVLDNAVDEAMQGYCDEITVKVESDGETISIEDNGRGIPVDIHPTKKISGVEVIMTILHSGTKFDANKDQATGGLHGVGVSCVNALSKPLTVEVWKDGGFYFQEYREGNPVSKLKKIRDLDKKEKQHGTRVGFKADPTIFKDGIKFDEQTIIKRLRSTAYLNKEIKINYINENTGTKEVFHFEGGISDYVKYLTENKVGAYPQAPIYIEGQSSLISRPGTVKVQVAMIYNEEDDETIISYVNNISTTDGGTHVSGFKTALTRVVNSYARGSELLKEKDSNLSGDDVREGLTVIISVRFPQPEFVGQTKEKLGTNEIESIVQTVAGELLTTFFEKNAAVAKKIVERAKIAQAARDAAKKSASLIKRKSLFGNHRMPGKLFDCISNEQENCELFIVEGASAAGSGKDGRDSKYQAILPIRGKIINAEKQDISSLLKNAEIQSLIQSIGTNIKDDFNIDNLRYGKIIIMCDADDDGCHIAILLITFFYRFMKELIAKGHVYLAQPPLFRVDNGKQRTYCFNEKEMQEAIENVRKNGGKEKVIRFKGLGEMDAEELGETTMNKSKRHLIKLSIDDAGEAERMISTLMGSNVQARKEHIVNQVNSLIHK